MHISTQKIREPLSFINDAVSQFMKTGSIRKSDEDDSHDKLVFMDVDVTKDVAEATLRLVGALRLCAIQESKSKEGPSEEEQKSDPDLNFLVFHDCYGSSLDAALTSILQRGFYCRLIIKCSAPWASDIYRPLSSILKRGDAKNLQQLSLVEGYMPRQSALELAWALMSPNHGIEVMEVGPDLSVVDGTGEGGEAVISRLYDKVEQICARRVVRFLACSIARNNQIKSLVFLVSNKDNSQKTTISVQCQILKLLSKSHPDPEVLKCKIFMMLSEAAMSCMLRPEAIEVAIQGFPFVRTLSESLKNLNSRMLEVHQSDAGLAMLCIIVQERRDEWSAFWCRRIIENKTLEAVVFPSVVLSPEVQAHLRYNKDGRRRHSLEDLSLALWPHILARINRLKFSGECSDEIGRVDSMHHFLLSIPKLLLETRPAG